MLQWHLYIAGHRMDISIDYQRADCLHKAPMFEGENTAQRDVWRAYLVRESSSMLTAIESANWQWWCNWKLWIGMLDYNDWHCCCDFIKSQYAQRHLSQLPRLQLSDEQDGRRC